MTFVFLPAFPLSDVARGGEPHRAASLQERQNGGGRKNIFREFRVTHSSRVPQLPFQVHKKRWQRSTRPLSWPKGTPRLTRRGGERGAAISKSAPGGRQARYATVSPFIFHSAYLDRVKLIHVEKLFFCHIP
jgi:hypothetical protein